MDWTGLLDSVFHGLFSSVDPLGMILRTLMGLLADALAKVATGMYTSIFDVTTVDLQQAAVANIWKITTGLSAALATILLVIAAFRSMVAQSNRYLMEALPGVVLAIVGPQAMSALLPGLAALFTSLANAIVATATPDLAESIRLLAGVGANPIYEGLGLLAPLIATMLLFGTTTVFFVLMFCMAAAVVLYALSPFAFAGLVMAPTRTWFTKWATSMFAVLFAKVPIAILLALSVALFANSSHASQAQSFANAAAGLILGLGAMLAPLMSYALFSFMSTVVARPAVPSGNPTQAVGTTYYSAQMGRAGVNGMRSVVGKTRSAFTGNANTAGADGSLGPAAIEPSAADRAAGATVQPPAASPGGTGGATAAGASNAAGATSTGGGAAATGTAAAGATAATGGAAAAAIVAAEAAKKAKGAATGAAASIAQPTSTPAAPSPTAGVPQQGGSRGSVPPPDMGGRTSGSQATPANKPEPQGRIDPHHTA
jgi:type IV secretion system protein TrbL